MPAVRETPIWGGYSFAGIISGGEWLAPAPSDPTQANPMQGLHRGVRKSGARLHGLLVGWQAFYDIVVQALRVGAAIRRDRGANNKRSVNARLPNGPVS